MPTPGDLADADIPAAAAGGAAGDGADDGAEPATDAGVARAPRRTDTKSPHRSRSRALKILFQADVRGVSPEVTLARLDDEPAAREIIDAVDDLSTGAELLPPVIEGATEIELVSSDQGETASGPLGASAEAPGAGDDSRLDAFTRSLVAGVHEDRDRIDGLIAKFARKWQISRMPVVDRTVLRLATYELIHEDTSPAIVIDEAVGLAKAMSTDDSGRYVNGVLESIRRELAANPLPREVPDAASAEAEELLDLAVTPAADVPPSSAATELDRSEAEPDPPAVEPDPPAVEPDPSEVEPDPSEVEPDPSAVEPDPPAVEPDPPAVEPDPSEAERDPPAPLPGTSDVSDDAAEAAPGDDEVSAPAPDPAEPRATPVGSDELSRAHPPHDDPPPVGEDPSPADEAAPGPVTHGQPSLFEDSLGR